LQHRQTVGREQDDLGALDVLQRPVAIINDPTSRARSSALTMTQSS
jgi:hypothetical protein